MMVNAEQFDDYQRVDFSHTPKWHLMPQEKVLDESFLIEAKKYSEEMELEEIALALILWHKSQFMKSCPPCPQQELPLPPEGIP